MEQPTPADPLAPLMQYLRHQYDCPRWASRHAGCSCGMERQLEEFRRRLVKK